MSSYLVDNQQYSTNALYKGVLLNCTVSWEGTMSGDGNFISPSMWIPHSVTDAILTCFNGWILTKECIHIQKNNAKYTTKYLKLWGLLCILCGTLSQLFRTMRYIPILCNFIHYIANLFSLSQAVILGFYQLSRLYLSLIHI